MSNVIATIVLVALISPILGAPTKFPSYEYSVGPEYFQNKLNSYRYNTKEEAAKYGEKKDNTLWGMPVSAVNAYYSPMKNEMVSIE